MMLVKLGIHMQKNVIISMSLTIITKIINLNLAWSFSFVTPALSRKRQEDCYKLEVIQFFTASSRPAKDT